MTSQSDGTRRGEDLALGIDPDTFGHDAIGGDRGRAVDAPDSRRLDAGCIRAAYEAIARAGEAVDAHDDATLVSLRQGARAAADAARVGDEIGAGAADALRAAARAWYPYAVEGQDTAWREGLGAFSQSCDAGVEADQDLLVHSVRAAADAIGDDDSSTARAARAFSAELVRSTSAGDALPEAWERAARHAGDVAADPVFQTVVDAVRGVLHR